LRRNRGPNGARRALRAAGVLPSPWRRRNTAPLPDSLRDRLLAIPGNQPAPRQRVVPRSIGSGAGSSWILASPWAPIAASFLIAVAVSLFVGNPYQVGAATLGEVREEMSPAAGRLLERANRLAGVAAGVGEVAVGALPRVGRGASRAIAKTLETRIGDREQRAADHRGPVR
jgi:hypothetical protein